jgi:hypothetical protein
LAPADFAKWWKRFRKTRKAEEPHETARRLRRKLRRVRVAERPAFVAQLFEVLLRQERAYGIALFVLEGLTDPVYLADVARNLAPLPELQPDDEESHLSDLVRVLAAVDNDDLLPPVRAYLLERPIGPHWPSVPWALWPHRKELFATAWSRFFAHGDTDAWNVTLIIKSFLTEPEAIGVVREVLAAETEPRWSALREALLRQAGLVGWLSPDQREALNKVIS